MQNEAVEPGIKDGNSSVHKQVFKPSAWLTKIDYINHLVLFNNAMIVVLAERASGKTTFASLLQSSLDSNIKSHSIQAKAPFTQADFLAQLDTVFHLRVDIEVNLANLVAQINERKAHVLVIIDDAQNLPDAFLQEALRELKNQGSNSFFHLCLISDHSLSVSLNTLEQDLLQILEPGNLTVSETKTYLRNVLPTSKQFDKTITDKRLEQFYELTEGNIARINAEMTDYFCPAADKSTEKRKYLIRGVSFVTAAAIALGASSYFLQNQFLPSSADLAAGHNFTESYAEIRQPMPSMVPVVPAIPVVEEEPVLLSQLPDINYQLDSRPSEIPSWYISAIRQQVQPSPKRVVDVAIEDENNDSLVVRDRVVVIPKTIKVLPSFQVADLALASKPIPSTQSSQPKVKVIDRPFTIQLLASSRQEDIMRFVNSHKIKVPIKIRLTKRNGMDWYVLTIGEYHQLEHAQAEMKKLPGELARFNPWIRPVSQLKALG